VLRVGGPRQSLEDYKDEGIENGKLHHVDARNPTVVHKGPTAVLEWVTVLNTDRTLLEWVFSVGGGSHVRQDKVRIYIIAQVDEVLVRPSGGHKLDNTRPLLRIVSVEGATKSVSVDSNIPDMKLVFHAWMEPCIS
jgi:hypothetical protein